MKWEVKVLNTTAEDGAWYEDLIVRLRHVTTGQYLGATDSRYPDTDCTVLYCTGQYLGATDSLYPDTDWGQGLREVAGAASGPGSYWKVASSSPKATKI